MTQRELARTLSLGDGIALALGSIAGSGILFLPSLTYAIAGHAVLLVWLGGILLCAPMMFMFSAMVRLVPNGTGIEGFVERGLGSRVASTVPVLFLALVLCGMPATCLVAGSYLADLTGGGVVVRIAGALVLLGVAIAGNLAGTNLGTRLQRTLTLIFVGAMVLLCIAAFPAAHGHYHAISPRLGPLGAVLSGIVLAFWAFAGFENLTFIAGEFRHPRRDFPLAIVISFALYGSLAVLLTATVAALVPRRELSPAGLLQLAGHVHPTWLASSLVAVVAFGLVQTAAVSWTWGISRLMFRAAQARRLPAPLGVLDHRGVPSRAIAVLGTGFLVSAVFVGLVPQFLVAAITIASSVFLFLYLLCVVAYLRIERSPLQRIAYFGFLVFLIGVLGSVGVKALYPVIVFCLALGGSFAMDRRRGGAVQVHLSSSTMLSPDTDTERTCARDVEVECESYAPERSRKEIGA